jgi:hypothetical protein
LGGALSVTARGKSAAKGADASRPFFVMAKAMTYKELSGNCVM